GSDTLYSNSGSSSIANTDVVVFTDIKKADATEAKVGNDLVITAGTDVLTLKDYYYTTSYTQWTVKEIRYSDTVTTLNHAPSGADQTVSTAQNTDYALKVADFGFSDTQDSPANVFFAVKIATLPAQGTLLLNGTAVTAGQTVTVADISAGNLVFSPANGASGTAYASFTFQVQDDGGTANGGVDLDPTANTITVNVTVPTPVNQAPAGADKTVNTAQDTAYTLKQADFGFTDTDGDSLLAVKIGTPPTAGSLKLDGVDVTAGQSITAADIAAGKLVFTPAAGASGTGYANFSFQVQDNGGTTGGGVDLDPSANTVTFNVGTPSVNHAPSGTDKVLSIAEDDTYTVSAGDFGFTDSVDGNSFKAVQITTLPTFGALRLNGADIVAGQFVTVAELNAGKLQFVPVADANGMPYASFTFQVQDDGGTASGVDLDPSANTLSIDVTPVNDAPKLPQPLSGHSEMAGQAFSYQIPASAFSDPDQGDSLSFGATLADGSALPAWLQFDATTRTFSGTAPATSGTLSIKVTATDGAGLSSSGEFSWVTSVGAVGGEATEGDDLLAGQSGQTDRFDGLGGDDAAVINDRQDRFSDTGSDGGFDVAVVTLPVDYRRGRGVEGLIYAGVTGSRELPISGNGDGKANVIGVYGETLLDTLYGKGIDVFPLFDPEGAIPSPAVDPSLRFYLDGKAGDDLLFGGDGNDILVGGDSGDLLYGGKGDDTYVLLGANANLEGIEDSGGTDTVVVDYALGGSAVQLPDGFENLIIKGRANVDGNGNSGDNVLAGNGGVNHLFGDAGDDTLLGGNSGSKSNDVLEGGDGSDSYILVGKNCQIVETDAFGAIDTVRSLKVNVDLSQLGDGGAYIERIVLEGSRSLSAFGNDGNNAILGNTGRNKLDGGLGNDLIAGGGGSDKLKGGEGADLFVFDGSKGVDIVSDYASGTDTLGLDGDKFAKLDADGNGRVDGDFFVSGAGAKPQDGDDYLIYDSKSGILWFDDDGSGGGKAVKVAVLSGQPEILPEQIQVTHVGVADLANQWLTQPLDIVSQPQ
ncbi:MAG: hypothetical protein FIA97_09175, partial [Methylococcaceae bacterium]|nr:hypothetical protein [Methylococcaceae bacterium]